MVLREGKRFLAWLDAQTPGRRLWLLLGAIGVALGLLSLIGGSPRNLPTVASDTAGKDIQSSVAAAAHEEGLGSLSDRPGVSGKPVRTIAVARAGPTGDASAAAGPAPSTGASAPAASASTGAAADMGSPPQKQQRVAEAPRPAGTPADAKGSTPKSPTQGDSPFEGTPALKTAETKMNIQDVKSPGGISAWLVEEHSVPLLAIRFVFDGGSSQDPPGKEGLANYLTAMMDEGAGDLDATHFQERMEELAVRMSFEDAKDALYGSFETLSANREPALEMLRLAVNAPRFDSEAVERIRKQLLANLAYAAKNPQQVAGREWYEGAFPGHPYGRHAGGTSESIASIQSADLEGFRKRTFARDTLKVVAVGDIDAKTLGEILDKVFGALPAKAELTSVSDTAPNPGEKLKVVEMDVPQSVVQFGLPGFARKDPDFIPAFVMNQILGGGGFASRLTEEVREKRGLAYSVYSYMQPLKHASTFGGGVATKNEAVKQSIDVIRGELERMAKDGPTETELANAKSYLTGSFALRFDTNAKIANQLLWMLNEDMGIDYPTLRNAMIEAVTMEDVKRAAKRLLKVDDLFITVVGKPKGLGNG
ncbi:MAG: M16 family metallopeptidase [Hyphomicrobiaceae bacterium]